MSYTNNIRNIFSIKFFSFAPEKIDRATLLELAKAFAVLVKLKSAFKDGLTGIEKGLEPLEGFLFLKRDIVRTDYAKNHILFFPTQCVLFYDINLV